MTINTNAASKLFICATPQSGVLDAAAFQALTYVEVKSVGNHGAAGTKTNVLNYDTWGDGVIQKSKGMSDAGSPVVDFARLPSDPGQIDIRAAAKTNFEYAFKIQRNDPATIGGTPTLIFNKGIVVGPERPFGKNEDFDIERFTLGFNQIEVVIDPT